ncbi:CMT1A duplicated region transcript 1 protein [Choloepus didactylus]|uniref:CMT1A duplicated region transcript 1 protein n=1 Tax=Choloepus didactylus TaxID=27675 RepID=UPI0018A0A47C|nr:CMT1A duplicated region transcript 1 protein [Choloepus didactylus]
MESLELRLNHATYFCCEKRSDSVPVCQKCETCILAWKIFTTKEWFQRISEISQRRFLVSILKQLNSLYLLHYFQSILQTTQGKDFIYNRSRVNLSQKEEKIVKSSLSQMLDRTVELKMKDILCWFGNSPQRTKASYTLLLLQMCEPKLLLTAAHVVRVLFLREQNSISGLIQDSTDVFFFPEKEYNPKSATSHVFWAARTKQTSFPMSKTSGKESSPGNVGGGVSATDGRWKSSLQCISEMNRLFSPKSDLSRVDGAPLGLLVDLKAVQDLSSGFSKYRDFIRHLPIHISKHILSLLDKNSLNRCASVSRHWATLAQQVKMDHSMHAFIQTQIAVLQGSYTKGIDPNYANKLSIPVPKMADEGKHMHAKNQKWRLRAKMDYNLWTAYQNQETLPVQMEERNVFCGSYNIRILSDTWDRNRVIHYSGGDMVAVSSSRRIHLLDIIQVKEVPMEFRGHAGSVRALILCEEENFILSGSYDLSIRYWDIKSGTCIRIFNGHQGTITCMDLYKNRLVSGARDGQVKVWDVETGKCLKTFKHKDPILATRISDTYTVSSCERGVVKVWHLATAQLVKKSWNAIIHCASSPQPVTLSGHEGAVKCLCFDQWHLLSGSADGLVMAWSMVGKYERCLMAFKHPKEVLHVSLLFLRVISACADGKIRIYNFLNGTCLKVMKANGRGDPVLSFFVQGNRMVINTESNIIMFQFENIKWQYSQDRSKLKKIRDKEREEDKEENELTDILSKSSTLVHSLKESVSSKQTVAQEVLPNKPHKTHVLLKVANVPTAALEPTQSQRKPKSPRKDGKKKPHLFSKEPNDLDVGQENLEAEPSAGDKMNAADVGKVQKPEQLGTSGQVFSCPKKLFQQVPMSPDQFLLTVNALQKAHNSGAFAYPHRPQTQVIDAWGPSISHPRKVLSFKGKPVQPALDRLRLGHPPMDVRQTSTPLEIQKLQPNLKNSLHSPRVQSTVPQPVIIRCRVSGSLKGEDGVTSSMEGGAHSPGPLTSTQVIRPNRMPTPSVDTGTLSLRRERPRFYTATTLNPFRMNTGFMLLTVRQENEYVEAKRKECQARVSPAAVDPEKARRGAWLRMLKGLPIDNFMKQGKTAAPELGQDAFI